MIAIVCVGMVVYPAKTEIEEMGRDDKQHRRCQQPGCIMNKKLLQHQADEPGNKECERHKAVVVFAVTMPEGIRADGQRQYDHSHFKTRMMDDINTKQGKAAEKKREKGTVNGTGQRGPDP